MKTEEKCPPILCQAHSATLVLIRAALHAWSPRVGEATSERGIAFLKSKLFVYAAPYNDTDKQPIIFHNSLVQNRVPGFLDSRDSRASCHSADAQPWGQQR